MILICTVCLQNSDVREWFPRWPENVKLEGLDGRDCSPYFLRGP